MSRHGPARASATTASKVVNLSYHGGPVMHSNRTHLIFWAPSGYSFPAGYETTAASFQSDVAADSGKATNVYAVDAQYGDTTGPGAYASTATPTIDVTDAYPASGCPVSSPYTACLTDGQLRAELAAVIAAKSLPRGLGDIYFLVTPSKVDSCQDASGHACASNVYCAYHSNFTSGGQDVLYAVDPFPPASGCDVTQQPNGGAIDSTLNTMSHEHSETITDPLGTGWYEDNPGSPDDGAENGDKCNFQFGATIGHTSSGGYDQAIGTGFYYLQQEWSNADSACESGFDRPPAPTASFTASPGPQTAGQPVSFDASASSAPAGGIASYSWDFGDGHAGAGQTASHAYAAPGSYTVRLTVTDIDGSTGFATQTIAVTAPDQAPVCAAVSATVIADTPVAIPLACVDPDPADTLSIAIATGPAHGLLAREGDSATYVPAAGFTGTDSFAVLATDNHGLSGPPAVVEITVLPALRAASAPPVSLRSVTLSRSSFSLSSRGTAGRVQLRYTIGEPAVTSFVIEAARPGTRRGRRCLAAAHPAPASQRCTLWTRVTVPFSRTDRQGTHTLRLSALLGRSVLRAGSYRIVVTAGQSRQVIDFRVTP